MLLNRQSAGNKKTIGVPGAHVRAGATWGPVVFDFFGLRLNLLYTIYQ